MMMSKVSHKLASANQEKMSDRMLYCRDRQRQTELFAFRDRPARAYNSLDVEEEHANQAVTRLVKPEEVDESVLSQAVSRRAHIAKNSENLPQRPQRSRSANACVVRSVQQRILARPSRPCSA